MSEWKVRDTKRGTERECSGRPDAEETKADMISLGASPEQLEIVTPETDGGTETVEPEVVDNASDELEGAPDVIESVDDLPDEKPSNVDQDPIEWVPDHFIDEIQGVPTLNRKAYCVLAERYGISVTAEPVTLPSETDFEYAEFRAIATTEDGHEYSGFGSAHVNRQDGDDPHLLAELAETRALKRAASWATGVGMTAVEEMQGEF